MMEESQIEKWNGDVPKVRFGCYKMEESPKRKKRCAAVVLSAGQGKRMQSQVPKQYLLIGDKPVIYYALKTFQDSFIDEIILVASKDDIEYCRKNVVEKYSFHKVTHIVAGGKERYHSVYEGIKAANCDYIFIHDGARPLVTEEMLERAYRCVAQYDACVIGMPSKDTVKIADSEGFAMATPNRDTVWTIQTPQVFSYDLIRKAYTLLIEKEQELLQKSIKITDDAMAVETFTGQKVKLIEGSYSNIKITTPEDLQMAGVLLQNGGK